MRVLSLFDGMSCGQIAMERAGIHVSKYFASEIDLKAKAVTRANYPNTVHLGDVSDLKYSDYKDIELLLGGSPCQGFSRLGKKLNFDDPRSSLFFEFAWMLQEIQPRYFLFENVQMDKEVIDTISFNLDVDPITLNSALVSAQNRVRLYWTNIPNVGQPVDKNINLKDVIFEGLTDNHKLFDNPRGEYVDKLTFGAIRGRRKGGKYRKHLECRDDKKCNTITTSADTTVLAEGSKYRYLTVPEIERLQTVPEGYTGYVRDPSRLKMLGNGWTVDIIVHILKGMK